MLAGTKDQSVAGKRYAGGRAVSTSICDPLRCAWLQRSLFHRYFIASLDDTVKDVLQEKYQKHQSTTIGKSAAERTSLAGRNMQSINKDTVIHGNQINNM